MRHLPALALGLGLLVGSAPSARAVDCYGSGDAMIAACSRMIASGKLTSGDLAIVHNNRGDAYRDKGEYDRAIADFNEAIRLNTRLAPPYHNRGNIYWHRGEYDPAIANFSKAIRLDPKFYKAYHNRADVLKIKGDFDSAMSDLNTAIRINPKDGLAYSSRGEIWRLKGDLDHSISDLDKAISVSQDPLFYTRRGDTWRYKGDLVRALSDFDRAIRIRPDFALAYVGKGLTYEREGNFARARSEFEKALAQPQFKFDSNAEAQATSRARLSALESGAEQPLIPAVPTKAANQNSIPTPSPIPHGSNATSIAQGRRIALVIGNSAYKRVPALTNPQKDAEAIAALLRSVGFDVVTLVADATREQLIEGLRLFANDAEKSDWAMVYYAGHGIEMNGQNYLIPVDATLAADRDVQFEAVPLEQVLTALEGARKLKLILLDACRDNPFTPQMRKTTAPGGVGAASTAGGSVGTRSIGRGLGEVKVQGASLVVFAAKHGQTALDGEGSNSPFAVAMIQRGATPGVEINKIFRLVRDDVMEATAGRQEPYTYGSLPGREDFFFVRVK